MNQEKFENLVLLICDAVPEKLTTTRLNKLLWLIDKTAFIENGDKITGCKYIKKQYGPVPVDNGEALGVMHDKGLINISIYRDEETDMARREYKGVSQANINIFSSKEYNIIQDVLKRFASWSARKLIQLSHDLIWANRDDWEEINFEAYLVKFNFSSMHKKSAQSMIEQAELAYEE